MGRRPELIIKDLEEIIYLLEIDGHARIGALLKEAVKEIESCNLEVVRNKDLLASKGLNLQS